jgi:hypothetical protein
MWLHPLPTRDDQRIFLRNRGRPFHYNCASGPTGFDRAMGPSNPMADRLARLDEIGSERLEDMDAAGIDLQVLLETVGASTEADAEKIFAVANDQLAKAISVYPDRFAGFASLPLSDRGARVEACRAFTGFQRGAGGRSGRRPVPGRPVLLAGVRDSRIVTGPDISAPGGTPRAGASGLLTVG